MQIWIRHILVACGILLPVLVVIEYWAWNADLNAASDSSWNAPSSSLWLSETSKSSAQIFLEAGLPTVRSAFLSLLCFYVAHTIAEFKPFLGRVFQVISAIVVVVSSYLIIVKLTHMIAARGSAKVTITALSRVSLELFIIAILSIILAIKLGAKKDNYV